MAIAWKITKTEYNTNSDKGIVHAAWECTNSEVVSGVTHTGTVSGMESYTPDASAAGYVAYDSVTEANVIDWIKATLTDAVVTEVETKVAAQITKSKTPPTAWGVPW